MIFKEFEKNPLLAPFKNKFCSKAVYNPAVIKKGKFFYMFFRAESKREGIFKEEGKKICTGRIMVAISKDGIHFKVKKDPVIWPQKYWEKDGCEDPRVVEINGRFWLTYVGLKRGGPSDSVVICLASSKDLFHWEKHGPILTEERSWHIREKSGAILNRKINGYYIIYFTGEAEAWNPRIGIAYSKDLLHWKEDPKNPILKPRKGFFDSTGVECGAPPILTEEGILMIYNGWKEDRIYRPGAVLFSKKNPKKILKRSKKSIIKPIRNWGRKFNQKDHIVAESLNFHQEKWYLYYGAADRVVCLATARNLKWDP